MKRFLISVKSIGYDTTTLRVCATGLADARKHVSEAITKWLEHNALDDDSRELASVSIIALKPMAFSGPRELEVEEKNRMMLAGQLDLQSRGDENEYYVGRDGTAYFCKCL